MTKRLVIVERDVADDEYDADTTLYQALASCLDSFIDGAMLDADGYGDEYSWSISWVMDRVAEALARKGALA